MCLNPSLLWLPPSHRCLTKETSVITEKNISLETGRCNQFYKLFLSTIDYCMMNIKQTKKIQINLKSPVTSHSLWAEWVVPFYWVASSEGGGRVMPRLLAAAGLSPPPTHSMLPGWGRQAAHPHHSHPLALCTVAQATTELSDTPNRSFHQCSCLRHLPVVLESEDNEGCSPAYLARRSQRRTSK